jgi:hypothetical protein
MSKWIMSELVRVLHDVSTIQATEIVEGLADRETPLIWEVNGKKRILNSSLSMRDRALLILHSSNGPVPEGDLVSWIEHSNASVFRRDVLRRAHKAREIEYNPDLRTAQISPLGIAYVEEILIPTLTR